MVAVVGVAVVAAVVGEAEETVDEATCACVRPHELGCVALLMVDDEDEEEPPLLL